MLAPLNLDPRSVMERHPRLVITSITDFGQNGPYRDYQATNAIMVAMSGMLFRSGSAGKPPLLPPGNLAYYVAGTMGAFPTPPALWQPTPTARRQPTDP